MPLDASYFPATAHLKQGMRVEFMRANGLTNRGDLSSSGVITQIWLGIEEMVEVRMDDGNEVCLCPALGDVIVGKAVGA